MPEAIAELRRLGVKHVSMLTGDNARTGRAIAAELGLDAEFAELKPEHKVPQIEQLPERYRSVAMVGDGINDAPALASADLGIAIGTGAMDAAIEAAPETAAVAQLAHRAATRVRVRAPAAIHAIGNLAAIPKRGTNG